MANVPSAKESPRVEDKILYWYEGDTFAIKINVTIKNSETQEIIPLEDGDIITLSFTKLGKPVKSYTYTDFTDNSFELVINEEDTKLFGEGTYHYTVTHERDFIRTIAHENTAIVE